MNLISEPIHIILGLILILSSVGVITAKQPVHSSLSFLLSLLILATLYLELSAQFIAIMQVFVYAGAILVIFMFVIVLFQDAHQQIALFKTNRSILFLKGAATVFLLSLVLFGYKILFIQPETNTLPTDYGTVQSLGKLLYLDYFFPFEAVIMIFLTAVVSTLYIAKKEK